ncbi:DUF5640 domain-containing protein [Bacteroides thetaiotaomicron]|nr:DUF5640 domain-containing protein [Bacteroides thetaiotaomicron]
MILLCPIVLGGCSSDDDDWMDLDSKHLVGTWSTGTEGTHKYLKFENDGTGYYALLNGASFLTNYLFTYEISGDNINIEITYSDDGNKAQRTEKSMGVFIFKRYIKDKERFRRWNLQEGRIKIGFPNV